MVRNDHKPLQKFLKGKIHINKVNHWSLELATYNITFEWISGTHNKAEDCLSRLVEVPGNDATASNILMNVITAPQPENHNNKVNHWSQELATYNITFEWISGTHSKAEDCLSRLVEVLGNDATASNILVNVITAIPSERPTSLLAAKQIHKW